MPRLKNFHFYPYSGWPEEPWSDDGPQDGGHDVDAAARSSRRVVEALSMRLFDADIQSRRGSYRAFLRGMGTSNIVLIDLWDLRFAKDMFLANVTIPPDFRGLSTDERADVLLRVAHACLSPVATAEGWMPLLNEAADNVRDANFECTWTSEWKQSRDRRFRVRLLAAIHDDGYGRWRLEIADSSTESATISDPVFGTPWIENFQKAAKAMKFLSPTLVSVPSRYGWSTEVDLQTGLLVGGSHEQDMFTSPAAPRPLAPSLEVRDGRNSDHQKLRSEQTSLRDVPPSICAS